MENSEGVEAWMQNPVESTFFTLSLCMSFYCKALHYVDSKKYFFVFESGRVASAWTATPLQPPHAFGMADVIEILDEKLLSNSHYNNPEGFFQIGTSPFYLL